MVKPIVLNQNPVSMIDLKTELEDIKKRDTELNFRSQKVEEYLGQFIQNEKKVYDEIIKKIEALKISRLKPEMLIKILDTLPRTLDDMKNILQGFVVSLSNEDMKKIMGSRVNMLKRKQGKENANPYGHDYLQGLGVFFILETDRDEDYDLPGYPRMPATVRAWQGLWKPLTFIVAGASLLFWLLHYAIIGPVGVKVVEEPEEEERELTEEEYDRLVRAKRRAGKAKRDVPKGYRPRKKKKAAGGKGKPPARRSRLPGRKARQEDEDDF